jgi:hypothetical protein
MPYDALNTFGSLDLFFAAIAFGGTFFFVLRVLWMLHTGGHDHAHDPGVGHTTDTHDADTDFKLLTVNTITAFLMIFGWAGLACARQFQLGTLLALLGASGAGLASMLGTAAILRLFLRLNSSGQRFDIGQAYGRAASVYQRIPPGGKGRIQIVLDGVTRELDAVSESKQEIESFKEVTVVEILDARTVRVARIS